MINWFNSLPPLDASGSGISPTLFWQCLSALGGAIVTLASLLYKNEKDAKNNEREGRLKAEAKLDKLQEITPDLVNGVRWLVEEAQTREDQPGPWPYNRPQPHRTNRSNRRGR